MFYFKGGTVILFVTSNTHCIFNEPLIVINGEEGTKEMSGNRIPVFWLSVKIQCYGQHLDYEFILLFLAVLYPHMRRIS